MFYRALKPLDYWPYKQRAIFFTASGKREELLKIISEVEKYEYLAYGLGQDGKFVIPIIELEPDSSGNFSVPDHFEIECEPGYYGKFELNLSKFYSLCEEADVPVFIDIFSED